MAHQQHHVIYIPGIHDDAYRVQGLIVKIWWLLGVHGHCHVMPWAGQAGYEFKIQRLRSEIDKYSGRGHRVSLIGASAGASAVLNLYIEDPNKISGVSLICPKINRPETVSQKTYAANPAFRIALELLQSNVTKLTATDKSRVTVYYSPKDGVVSYADGRIPAVQERRLPPVRHGFAIIYALTLGSPRLLNRLKQSTT